ncbi:MAG: nicotinate (nicotinamide) nucleotide adenylyltransferase, partial [Gemmatimonadetes bacterium]|nr:nicotinate (nicotinamide) nucleotide adenylyltransferase [Gemmatimonadota bacterium]
MSLRIGIFGGTFDPIHLGHLLLAELTRGVLGLDRVLFVPARIPPHKGGAHAPPEQRMEMAGLATDTNPHFEVSDVEVRRDGPSYTVDTLRHFRSEHGDGTEHYLMMGADSARDLETWREHDQLLRDSTVVVMGRPGVDRHEVSERVARDSTFLSTPLFEISSSEIRRRVHAGET